MERKSMKKTLFTYIFAFFFCLFFIVGTVSAFFYTTVFDSDKYMKQMEKNNYSEIVVSHLYNQLDSIGDVISIDTDDIFTLLRKDDVVTHSKNYTKTYLEAILNGKSFSDSDVTPYSIEYAKSDLEQLVKRFYETSENSFSEEEFEIIYDYIEKHINSSLKFLSSSILEKTIPLGKYAVLAKDVFKTASISLVFAFILLLATIFINRKDGIAKMIYKVGGIVFVPSAIIFIPTFLFDNYNLGSKVAIARSPLSVVFASVIDTIVKGLEEISGAFFAISFILVVVGAILISKNIYGKKAEKEITQ